MSIIHSWDTSQNSQELSNLMSSPLHNFTTTQQWTKKKGPEINHHRCEIQGGTDVITEGPVWLCVAAENGDKDIPHNSHDRMHDVRPARGSLITHGKEFRIYFLIALQVSGGRQANMLVLFTTLWDLQKTVSVGGK